MKSLVAGTALVVALSASAMGSNHGLSFIGGLGHANDVVVAMDAVVYGKPVAIAALTEPASLFLFGAGILLIASRYRTRR